MFKLAAAAPPYTQELLAEVRCLFLEYASSLNLDLEFQGFARELRELPGEYAPPRGLLILAWPGDRSSAAGCIALRPLGADVCEMKRLYVRPLYRGLGIGRALSVRLIEDAARLGYLRMRLDTLSCMAAATGLYRSLGFREIPAYYHNPLPGPLYFEKELRR